MDKPTEARGIAPEASQTSLGESVTVKVEPQPQRELDAQERQQLEEKTRRAELTRMKELEAIGAQFDIESFAREHIQAGTRVDEFRRLALDELKKRAKPLPLGNPEDAEVGLSRQEVKQFSFLRALRALTWPNERRYQEEAAFEFECSIAAGQKRGKAAQGILVPVDILRGGNFLEPGSAARNAMSRTFAGSRALNVTSPAAGGYLVAEDLLSADFITVLRNATAILRMGATTLGDLEGNIAIPKQLTGAAAGWITPEGSDSPESEATFGQVPMSPKTLGAHTEYTRQLLLQSSIDIENFVRSDLTIAIGLAMDHAGLYGDGTGGAPIGVKNQTGVTPVDYAADDPTHAEVVQLETEVATRNALMGSMGYIVDAAFRGYAKTTLKAAGVAGYIWEPGDTVNGYNTAVTNQVTTGDQFFGNWADLLIGMWGGLDLLSDPFTKSKSGNVVVTGLQSIDIAVRHGESFSYGANITP